MTTGADFGGAGQAPLSVDQGRKKKRRRQIIRMPAGFGKAADKTPEPFSTSKTSNWVARRGGLPNYIQHVAHALVRDGMDESRAIATAVNTIKRWARGGGGVSKDTQAAAAKALAEWESKKASA